MKFTHVGKKLEVTDALKDYAEKKLKKLDRYFSDDAEAAVLYRMERGRSTAEVTVRCANLFFRAQQTTNDMYAAIDAIVDVIDRQIRKNKTKLEKRLRSGGFEREIPAQEAVEDEANYDIIRRKRFAIKPLDPEEAILQMNMLGHQFYAFQNADDNNRFCVVYKRTDGGYGLIESE